MRRWRLALAILIALGWGDSILAQASPGETDAQRAVRDTLASGPDLPWYDPARDTLRKVELPPRPELQGPGDWEQQARSTETEQRPNEHWNLDPLWTLVQWVTWGFLAALAVIAIWQFIRHYLRREAQSGTPVTQSVMSRPSVAHRERLQDLPVDLPDADGDLLVAVQRCYEHGDYDQAIVLLFSYQLLELDRQHRLQLARGKTNRRYLRELAGQPPLQQLLAQTMVAFEACYFGRHPVTREGFEVCWRQLDRFHELASESRAI